jgi:hypothetical protein
VLFEVLACLAGCDRPHEEGLAVDGEGGGFPVSSDAKQPAVLGAPRHLDDSALRVGREAIADIGKRLRIGCGNEPPARRSGSRANVGEPRGATSIVVPAPLLPTKLSATTTPRLSTDVKRTDIAPNRPVVTTAPARAYVRRTSDSNATPRASPRGRSRIVGVVATVGVVTDVDA